MGIESVVNVVLSAASGGVAQASFGSILILGGAGAVAHIPSAEKARTYSSLTAMSADGFTSDDGEYRLAQRLFSQTPRAKSVVVARRAVQHTQAFTLTPVVGNATRYAVEVEGVTHEYTSDGSATAAEIVAGLATALGTTLASISITQNSTNLRVVANEAGVFVQVRVMTPSTLKVAQDGADPGVAADLDALVLASVDFYGVVTPFASKAEVSAIAAWVEANRRFFFVSLMDSAMADTAYDSSQPTANVGSVLKSNSYVRTFAVSVDSSADFTAEGALSYLLGTKAGSATLSLKTVKGATATARSDTQRGHLKSYNLTPYVFMGGSPVLLGSKDAGGRTSGGEWPDVVRDTDEFVARTQERVFFRLRTADKVPYTDDGIAVITAELGGQAQAGILSGFLANDEGRRPAVIAPRASAVSSTDRDNRVLPGVSLTAYIAGAIHSVDPLTITFLA